MSLVIAPLSLAHLERSKHVAHLKPGDQFANEKGELCIYLGFAMKQDDYNQPYLEAFYGKSYIRFKMSARHVYVCRSDGNNWCLPSSWPDKIGVYKEPQPEYDSELEDL